MNINQIYGNIAKTEDLLCLIKSDLNKIKVINTSNSSTIDLV